MVDIIKPWNIYVDNKKVATASGMDSNLDAPGELQITAEGVIGRAQGVTTAKVTLNSVTTFGGKAVTQKLVQALLGNIPVKLTLGPIDGKLREYSAMWCNSETQNTEFANGTAKGTYNFEGAAPKITG